jgi:hypothetical protein
MATEETKPFEKISVQGDIEAALQIRYGEGPDDPLPFILILKASYVAHALQKPISIQDLEDYERKHADDLKARAQNHKARGYTTLELE